MKKSLFFVFRSILLAIFVFTAGSAVAQTTLYDEGVSGDLPGTGSGTSLTISAVGTYIIKGSLATPGDQQDRYTLTVNSGLQITNVAYSLAAPGSFNGFLEFDGNDIIFSPGSGSGNYSFSYPLAAGSYFGLNSASFSVGNNWQITITVTSACTAPSITTNPSNQTLCSGATATFTAAASGSPTVQWQKSTDGGATFNDIVGATSTTLSFSTVSGDNGNEYQAVFTNGCGSATTTAATLTVNTAPSVTTNPTNQTVCAGNTASFTAAASGTPAPTVQWQVSTNGGATYNNIPGANGSTYSFATVAADNGKLFRAVFTNTCGSATTTGGSVTVNITPTITGNPSNINTCSGNFITFTSSATGSTGVQWQNSTNGGATWNNLLGATSASLSFITAASQNGNQYRAVYTNGCGNTNTTAAILTINDPAVTTNPTNQTVCQNSTVTFTASASGSPAPTVQWQVSTDGGATWGNYTGATSTTLSWTAGISNNGWQVRAVFSNACTSVTTTAALLTINTTPLVTVNPSNQSVCVGNSATFSTAASGTAPITLQWQLSTDGQVTWNDISGATSNNLVLTPAITDNGNWYRTRFTNGCGTTLNNPAQLTVNSVTVTTNPVSQTTCAGNPVTFTAAATAQPSATVQWQVSTDGGATYNNVLGATSTTFTFVTTSAQNGNQYRAVFTNTCGNFNTTSATLTVNTPIAIVTNPSNLTVCQGSNVSFTASASGNPAPTVQWLVSTDGGSTWGIWTGATSNTLSFTAGIGNSGWQLEAVYTNICGTLTTSAAILNINTQPAITTQPLTQAICVGNTVTFTAAASGIPAATVQWYVSTDGTTYSAIPGATSSTLSFATTLAMNGNYYRAAYTNVCGFNNTNPAQLNINVPPVVSTNPSSQTVCANNTVTFTASGTGTPAPAIQWQQSTDGGTTWANVGTGGSTYSVLAGAGQNGNRYRAVLSNVCGSATTTAATLTVNTSTSIVGNPASQSVCAGNTATFTAAANGSPVPTVQWYTSSDGGITWVPITGATSSTLSFAVGNINNGWFYHAVFTNACGTATSSNALLTVNNLGSIITNPASQTVCTGTTVTFSAACAGSPAPAIQWQLSTDGGVTWNNVTGATASILSFSTLTTQSGNKYRAVFTNTCGINTTSAATLTVNTGVTITTNPTSVTICPGNTVSFSAAATGTPSPALQWQQSTNGGVTWANVGAGTSPYSIFAGTGQTGWQYRAVFTNSCGTATTTAAVINENSSPVVTTNPVSQTVCTGSSVTFSAAATGTPSPTVQWSVSTDGGATFSPIGGATSTSLTFITTSTQNNSIYQAVFVNACGFAATTTAMLNVNTPPVAVSTPANVTVCPNTTVSFTATANSVPAPNVQWQESVNGGVTWSNVGPGTAVTTSTYSLLAGLAQNGWQFRAVFTNVCGTATSPVATLTVNTPPSITSQPVNVQNCEGGIASFTVSGSGTGVAYDWYVSTNNGLTYTNTSVLTPTITINPLTRAYNGVLYRCTISGTCPSPVVSNNALLVVDSMPVILTQPANVRVCSGTPVVYQITANGSNINYTWQVNTGTGFTNITPAPLYVGINTNALQVTTTTNAMAGYQYRCVVNGTCAPAATSNIGTLTIDTLPSVVLNPVPVTICEGNGTSYVIKGSGTNLRYQWQVNNGVTGFRNLSNAWPYSGVNTPNLAIAYAMASMNGYMYQCVISGRCSPSVTTTSATLTVNTAPKITYQSQSTTVCNTANDSFTVIATGTNLLYQWQLSIDSGKDWGNIPAGTLYSNVTTPTLVITGVSNTMNKYQYRCIVSGTCPPPDTSKPIILTVTNITNWTGAVNSNWSNIGNWSCGVLPVATTEVYIPYAAPHMPVVDIPGAICDSIFFGSTSSLAFSGTANMLEVRGSMICNKCSFDASLGSVLFSRNGDQIVQASTFKNLTLTGSGNKILKGGDSKVTGSLNLTKGLFVLGDNTVTIGPGGQIVGGSSTATIVTNGKGVVKMQNIGTGGNTGTITVPLSDGSDYTPIDFSNSGNPQTYSIAVYNNIYNAYDAYFKPAGVPFTSNAVGKSWRLSTDTPKGSNVTLTLHWNGSDEFSGFNRNACYISTFSTPNWLPAPAINACSGNNPYSLTMSGLSQMTVFAVTSSVSDSTFIARKGTVLLYPNPSSSILNVKFNGTPGRNVNIYMLNSFGREVYRVTVNPYIYTDGIVPVNVTNLYPGEYQVIVEDVNDNSEVRTARFIKL